MSVDNHGRDEALASVIVSFQANHAQPLGLSPGLVRKDSDLVERGIGQ